MRRIKLPQLGVVVVLCALVGALAGIAGSAAAPSKSSKKSSRPSSSAPRAFHLRGVAPGPGPGPGFMGGPGGPAVHSEAVVPNKAGDGFITVTSDGGTVKSISGNDITIDESVGKAHYKDATVTIPSGATVIRNHAKAALSDIKTGDDIRVIASSEQTIVIAEDATFQANERKLFEQHGPWERGHSRGGAPRFAPPPGNGSNNAAPPPPQGAGTTY